MRLDIQFFSQLRNATGTAKIAREVPDGACVSDLLAMLYREFSGLEKWDAHIRVAVGVEWVERDYVLHEGGEVSIMPPVSGG